MFTNVSRATVLQALSHFNGRVTYTEGGRSALVNVRGLRLLFEVLDAPLPLGFDGERWVSFVGVVY